MDACYEIKLCILRIVSGFRNRPKPDLWFNPYIATFHWSSLLFWIPQTYTKNNLPLKIAPKIGKFVESAKTLAEFGTVCGI